MNNENDLNFDKLHSNNESTQNKNITNNTSSNQNNQNKEKDSIIKQLDKLEKLDSDSDLIKIHIDPHYSPIYKEQQQPQSGPPIFKKKPKKGVVDDMEVLKQRREDRKTKK